MLWFGSPNVEKMKARRDVKGLIKALGYQKDARIRRSAAIALGEIKDPLGVEPLIGMLGDGDEFVRALAASALSKIGDARAVDPLISRLADSSEDVRLAAVTALGHIGDARAIEPILHRLAYRLLWDHSSLDLTARGLVVDALANIGEPAVKPLIAALKDIHLSVCLVAIIALGRIGDVRAVRPLLSMLKDEDSELRSAAAFALGEIGDTRAVAPLKNLLEKEKEPSVKAAAEEALGQLERTQ